jgi:hypothetical protein
MAPKRLGLESRIRRGQSGSMTALAGMVLDRATELCASSAPSRRSAAGVFAPSSLLKRVRGRQCHRNRMTRASPQVSSVSVEQAVDASAAVWSSETASTESPAALQRASSGAVRLGDGKLRCRSPNVRTTLRRRPELWCSLQGAQGWRELSEHDAKQTRPLCEPGRARWASRDGSSSCASSWVFARMRVAPAHATKHLNPLRHPLAPSDEVVELRQDDAAQSTTGSTVWLGAQVRSVSLRWWAVD